MPTVRITALLLLPTTPVVRLQRPGPAAGYGTHPTPSIMAVVAACAWPAWCWTIRSDTRTPAGA